MTELPSYKQPVSVLVVVHTPEREVLLLERVRPPGFWQSVTGSLEEGETPQQAAIREVAEETGIAADADNLHDWQYTNRFEIRPEWRHRYAPDVSHNVEHVFSLCVPSACAIVMTPDEHLSHCWLTRDEAAKKVFSATNRDAILRL